MNIVGCVPRLLKAHGGWILTGLSILGLTGTAYLTAKAAPKAHQALCDAESDKQMQIISNMPFDEYEKAVNEPGYVDGLSELTFGEKFEAVAPHYLPAFLCYIVTAGCMIGAQIFNVKQQAALVAAYGLLAQEFDGYRSEVRNEIGKEREQQIFTANHQKMIEMQKEIRRLRESNDVQTYMITTLPNVTFDLRPADIEKAIYNFNRDVQIRGGAPEAELYEFIGIPRNAWGETYTDEAEEYGWETYENEISWGSHWVDFLIRQIHLKNEKTVNLICPTIPPYRLGLDYGMTASSCDNLHHDCSIDYDDMERWLNSIEGQATVFAEPSDKASIDNY